MKLKEHQLNSVQGFKIILGALFIATLFNLQGLSDWANSKDISTFTVLLVKTTEAFNHFGEEVKINHPRTMMRTAFTDFKLDRPLIVPSRNSVIYLAEMVVSVRSEDIPRGPMALPPVIAVEPPTKMEPKMALQEEVMEEKLAAPTPSGETLKTGLNNRVLVFGDSMLKSGIQVHIKNFFSKKYPQVDIDIDSQSGTGLARPEVFNWSNRLKEKTGKFDYVVIMLGTNDAQNFKLGKKVIPFGTETWDQEYSGRVQTLAAQACEKAHRVLWVGSIQMRSEKFNSKMVRLHGVAKKALKSARCAEYVSPEKWVSDGEKYVDHLNVKKKNGVVKNIKVRNDDGIHLSFEGAELFAKKLIEKVNYEN